MSSENEAVRDRESYEIPGVGELRARPGTSTAELAGAAHYWSKKYSSAFEEGKKTGLRDGFLAAGTLIAFLEIASRIGYHYLRSH